MFSTFGNISIADRQSIIRQLIPRLAGCLQDDPSALGRYETAVMRLPEQIS